MVKYLERIPQVRTAVSSALLALGDGNWKMGEGVQVGKSLQGGITDENIILEHFLCKLPHSSLHNNTDWLSVDDVATNTINSLNAISRLRRPAFGSIFLLNNISYLRRHLLLQPDHPDLGPLISQPIIDTIHCASCLLRL